MDSEDSEEDSEGTEDMGMDTGMGTGMVMVMDMGTMEDEASTDGTDNAFKATCSSPGTAR